MRHKKKMLKNTYSIKTESLYGNRVLDIVTPIQGWLDEMEILFLHDIANKAVQSLKNSECLVEIGSFMGRSTIAIALACKDQNKGKLIAIDPHQSSFAHKREKIQNSFFILRKNLVKTKLDKVVTIQKKTSKDAYKELKFIHTRFIYIDGDHEFKSVFNDFNSWNSTLQNDGYLMLHDSLNIYGPRKMLFSLLLHPKFKYFGNVGDLACFQKKQFLTIFNWIKKLYAYILYRLLFYKIYRPAIQ